MFRRNYIPVLLDHPASVPEIARHFDISPKEVASDLEHLQLSMRRGEYEFVFTPAECRKCGFEFTNHRFRRPGKCPECKGTWIYEPLISVRIRVQN